MTTNELSIKRLRDRLENLRGVQRFAKLDSERVRASAEIERILDEISALKLAADQLENI